MRMKTGDKELAARAANGDVAAFQVLLERHYDRIFRVALQFTAAREDAEDIAQNVCLGLAAKLRSFRGEAQFSTWIYRVVVNATRDFQRRQASTERLHREYSEISSLTRGTDRQAARELEWLYEMLQQMGKDLKETAILVLAEGLSHAQAANVLQIKESTVSWRMHELRKKLKTLADEEA